MGKQAVNEAAAFRFATGALKGQDVPVGRHRLDGVRIIIECPDGAVVVRGKGNKGKGFDEYTATSKGISLAAVLLFLGKCNALKGRKAIDLWVKCIKAAVKQDAKAEGLMPPEALEAERRVKAKLKGCKAIRKTPAELIGLENVQIRVEVLGKPLAKKRAA